MGKFLKRVKNAIILVIVVAIAWTGWSVKIMGEVAPSVDRANQASKLTTDSRSTAGKIVKLVDDLKSNVGDTGVDDSALKAEIKKYDEVASKRVSVVSWSDLSTRDGLRRLWLTPFQQEEMKNDSNDVVNSLKTRAEKLDSESQSVLLAQFKYISLQMAGKYNEWKQQLPDDKRQLAEDVYLKTSQAHAWNGMSDMFDDVSTVTNSYEKVLDALGATVSQLHANEAKTVGINTTDGEQAKTKASEVAQTMGVQIVYTSSSTCEGQSGENSFTAGFYCYGYSDSRDKIFINTGRKDWVNLQVDPWFVDVVKHELSHRSIMITCGVLDPKIAVNRVEAVTNSYSYLYYGANRALTEKNQEGFDDYKADANTDAIAKQIHDEGKCQ